MSAIRLRAIALRNAFKQLGRMPLSSLLNTLVIGIAVSFPLGLYTLLINLEGLLGQLPQQNQITLFLKPGADATDLKQVQKLLQNQPELAGFKLIDRKQALETMKQTSVGSILEALPENPLPDAFTLMPKSIEPTELQHLVAVMQSWPQVESIQHDSDWAKRLAALLAFGEQLTWLLAVALGAALLVIVGNAIRMQVLTRRDEIEVSKLIGATNSFIRRPFAYFGLLQGALGAALGVVCVTVALHFIGPNVNQVAALYASSFALHLPAIPALLGVVATTALLCWIGALLAVNRHLRELEQ
ncbi:MAG: permease-like cell division protein FtsX [Chitinivorax sp.]